VIACRSAARTDRFLIPRIEFIGWTWCAISVIVVMSSSPAQRRFFSNLLFAFSPVRCVANLLTSLFSHFI